MTVDQVVAVLLKNASLARDIVAKAAPKIAAFGAPAPCSNALASAILTHKEAVPYSRKRDLAPILGKYMPA